MDITGPPHVVVVTMQVVSVVGSDVADKMVIWPPDGLPPMVRGRLGDRAGDSLGSSLSPARRDAILPFALDGGLSRAASRASKALFPTGVLLARLLVLVATPPAMVFGGVVPGGSPPLPVVPPWALDCREPLVRGRGGTHSGLAAPSLFSIGTLVARRVLVATDGPPALRAGGVRLSSGDLRAPSSLLRMVEEDGGIAGTPAAGDVRCGG